MSNGSLLVALPHDRILPKLDLAFHRFGLRTHECQAKDYLHLFYHGHSYPPISAMNEVRGAFAKEKQRFFVGNCGR